MSLVIVFTFSDSSDILFHVEFFLQVVVVIAIYNGLTFIITLFHHSYLKEVLILRGFMHVYLSQTFCFFKFKARYLHIIIRYYKDLICILTF